MGFVALGEERTRVWEKNTKAKTYGLDVHKKQKAKTAKNKKAGYAPSIVIRKVRGKRAMKKDPKNNRATLTPWQGVKEALRVTLC